MSTLALVVTLVCYIVTAADLAAKKQYGLSLAFAAYALANIGFIWSITKG